MSDIYILGEDKTQYHELILDSERYNLICDTYVLNSPKIGRMNPAVQLLVNRYSPEKYEYDFVMLEIGGIEFSFAPVAAYRSETMINFDGFLRQVNLDCFTDEAITISCNADSGIAFIRYWERSAPLYA